MIVIYFLLFAFWLTVIPWCIGLIFNRWYTGEKLLSWSKTFLFGLMTEFVIFQLFAICLTFLRSSLTLLTILWLVSCGILFILGIREVIKKRKLNRHTFTKERKRRSRKKNIYRVENAMVLIAAIVLILFQVIFVTLHVHDDLDDAWYVGTAVISYFTNTLNLISPYTGEIMEHFAPDYVLSPWPIFCAMLGKLSFTHPAIIMHTFIPIIMIPLCYLVYFLLGKEIFNHNINKVLWLLLFLCILNIYGNWSIRSTSTFLLFRVWQGKAILSNCIIPLIIYIFIHMINDKDNKKIYFVILFITVMASTMISSMGVFLGPVILFALSLVDLLKYRRIENCIKAFICIIPCILQFIVYIGMRY